MSTSNFYKANAEHYYAFGMNCYYDKETLEMNEMDLSLEGQYDEIGTEAGFEFTLDNCKEKLQSCDWNLCDGYEKGCRDFGLIYIAEKTEWVNVHGVEFSVTVKAGYRGGYYEGANFDYIYEIENVHYYGYEYDELPDLSDIEDAFCNRNRVCKNIYKEQKLHKKMQDSIQESMDRLSSEIEDIFSECCEVKLGVTAHFSNGETCYGQVE